MKSILLLKFVFFRSRLRLSLKNTNLLFYYFICYLQGCCISYYNIPPSLSEGAKGDIEIKNGTPRVSLRLGRALVLTTHCVVIHYARVATLRRPLQDLISDLNYARRAWLTAAVFKFLNEIKRVFGTGEVSENSSLEK